ncbi:MAG: tRNA 2-thiouridine(34) synthase MnmA [Lentisphaerae bacterium]|nr:tRNA 2-thiouridine(34) synthase MnmA [Lentisphaerota bacterium]
MNNKHDQIAVGMSGGLDSSVAAALLVDMGYKVVGLTVHMWKDGSHSCLIDEDVERARQVCSHLNIRHHVLNGTVPFMEHVVEPFVRQYANGLTPSPCVSCNEKVKFGFLLTRAVRFDCVAMATGHYARVIKGKDGKYRLFRAADTRKDQSYFLHRLSQRQLACSMFPLGDMSKELVKEYAAQHGLPLESGRDSQDLCFVKDDQVAEFVEERLLKRMSGGLLMSQDGRVLGEHAGIHRYTVGQRRGLGIASTEPMYVTSINPENNSVIIGPRESAVKSSCMVSNTSWITGAPPADGKYKVCVRYRHEPAIATIRCVDHTRMFVEFGTPQFAISPGQAAVVYADDEVLGGGWITRDGE